jgi:hypothetical protein
MRVTIVLAACLLGCPSSTEAPTDSRVVAEGDAGMRCLSPGEPGGPGARCRCDSDCVSGAECVVQAGSGFAGGFCAQTCTPGTDECGPGALCELAVCFPRCESAADCAPDQICDAVEGACSPWCTTDAHCVGDAICNVWSGVCTTETVEGAGVFAPCLRDDDCRSNLCGVSRRCETFCNPERPSCPTGSTCVPGADPERPVGSCRPDCLVEADCPDDALTCVPVGKQPVCLIE